MIHRMKGAVAKFYHNAILTHSRNILCLSLLCTSLCAAQQEEPPFELPPQEKLNRLRTAVIYTEHGELKIELFPETAPWHVANLKYLADKGFYKNLKFHIFQPGYIIQTGDPTGKGMGGPGYSLPPEFSEEKHLKGTVGMARSADLSNPSRNSNGSQFHILLNDAPHMNGQYTIFGRVVEGFRVLEQLNVNDKVVDLKVFVRPDK